MAVKQAEETLKRIAKVPFKKFSENITEPDVFKRASNQDAFDFWNKDLIDYWYGTFRLYRWKVVALEYIRKQMAKPDNTMKGQFLYEQALRPKSNKKEENGLIDFTDTAPHDWKAFSFKTIPLDNPRQQRLKVKKNAEEYYLSQGIKNLDLYSWFREEAQQESPESTQLEESLEELRGSEKKKLSKASRMKLEQETSEVIGTIGEKEEIKQFIDLFLKRGEKRTLFPKVKPRKPTFPLDPDGWNRYENDLIPKGTESEEALDIYNQFNLKFKNYTEDDVYQFFLKNPVLTFFWKMNYSTPDPQTKILAVGQGQYNRLFHSLMLARNYFVRIRREAEGTEEDLEECRHWSKDRCLACELFYMQLLQLKVGIPIKKFVLYNLRSSLRIAALLSAQVLPPHKPNDDRYYFPHLAEFGRGYGISFDSGVKKEPSGVKSKADLILPEDIPKIADLENIRKAIFSKGEPNYKKQRTQVRYPPLAYRTIILIAVSCGVRIGSKADLISNQGLLGTRWEHYQKDLGLTDSKGKNLNLGGFTVIKDKGHKLIQEGYETTTIDFKGNPKTISEPQRGKLWKRKPLTDEANKAIQEWREWLNENGLGYTEYVKLTFKDKSTKYKSALKKGEITPLRNIAQQLVDKQKPEEDGKEIIKIEPCTAFGRIMNINYSTARVGLHTVANLTGVFPKSKKVWGFHIFRKTFVQIFKEKHVPTEQIQEIGVGWEDIKTLIDHYVLKDESKISELYADVVRGTDTRTVIEKVIRFEDERTKEIHDHKDKIVEELIEENKTDDDILEEKIKEVSNLEEDGESAELEAPEETEEEEEE